MPRHVEFACIGNEGISYKTRYRILNLKNLHCERFVKKLFLEPELNTVSVKVSSLKNSPVFPWSLLIFLVRHYFQETERMIYDKLFKWVDKTRKPH